jgi:putative membrane protein
MLVATEENFPKTKSMNTVTMMIQRSAGEATVTGQAFGKIVVLMITLAPGDMEDLPELVSDRIKDSAARNGLSVLIIDAHNSISGQTSISPGQAEDIVKAAINVLDLLNEMVQTTFLAGVAEDPLSEFDLRDGIGPGGLSVLTVKNAEQTAGYVTIDGNNMEKGFRQVILDRLKGLGVLEAEVMTTDTHLVTGLVRSPLGYYPVGTHLPKGLLVDRIEDTVQRALSNMEPSFSGYASFKVTVGVLGTEAFNSITGFIGKIGRRIARSFYWLELSSILLNVLILYLVYSA